MAKGRASSKKSPKPATRRPAPSKSRGPALGLSDDEDSDASTGLRRREEDTEESEGDEAVFDLAGSDGSDDQQGSDDSDEDDSDEDDSDSDIEETDMDRLVNNLPSTMRQRILRGDAGEEEDSLSEGSDDDEEEEEGWGRKKKTYWSGDTGDLEIGQDVQDAEDEEEAAMELERARSSGLDASDYYEGMDASGYVRKAKAGDSKGKKDSFKPDKLQKALELAAGVSDSVSFKGSMEIENIPRDAKAMSKEQRLALLAVDTPELPGLAEELAERIAELQQKINPARDLVRQVQSSHGEDACADEIVQYLEVKQQMLLSYCTNLTFYMLLKSQGKSVRSHPVMRQLLELRYAMEKLRPLDGKLQYQIDRLVKLAADGEGMQEALEGVARNRPNPFNLAARDGGDSSEGGEEDDQYGAREVKDDGIYRPPRMQAVMYNENEKQLDKAKEKLKSKRSKLKNSEIMESLREEFGVAPEMSSSAGHGVDTADLRALKEEEEERRQYEEDRFVRLTMTRKDKKDIRKRERESAQALNNIADIGDIGEFEELNDLSAKYLEKSAEVDGFPSKDKRATGSSAARKATSERDSASALQRAVSAFSFGSGSAADGFDNDDVEDVFADTSAKRKKSKPSPAFEEDDDDYGGAMDDGGDDYYGDEQGANEFDRMLAEGDAPSGKRRRPAPSDFVGQEDDDMLEAFASKKKDFMKKKKDFYTAPTRVGGREETVGEGQKRGVSYEIMANKGLMPHRKKANRNPRVKKREMYAKAVIARKGQVREVVSGAAGAYGGEKTGIKANVSRSRRINT